MIWVQAIGHFNQYTLALSHSMINDALEGVRPYSTNLDIENNTQGHVTQTEK